MRMVLVGVYYNGEVETYRVKDNKGIYSVIKFPERWQCDCGKENCKHIKRLQEFLVFEV